MATAAVALLLAGALGGCVETTQEKNARATLVAERLVAGRDAVHVTRSNPRVAVLGVSMVRGGSGTAVAVTLRNDSTRAVSDLPVSVGVRTRSGRVEYLNRQPELPYFQTHVAGLAPGAPTTWVFATHHQSSPGRPFARVGASTIPAPGGVSNVPTIAATATSARAPRRGSVSVTARAVNKSGVDQTALQLYAYALSRGRLVAAGTANLGDLGGEAVQSVQIPLIGNPGSTTVHVEAPPTNLR